jgi:hypothetical protein
MTLDDSLTGLQIGVFLALAGALLLLWAAAYTMACRAIEAHRRVRRRGDDTGAQEHQDAAAEPAGHDPAATQAQAWLDAITELDQACCERWWTSLATDHDPTCPNQTRKEPR